MITNTEFHNENNPDVDDLNKVIKDFDDSENEDADDENDTDEEE